MNVALQVLGHPGLHVTVFDPDIITEANIGRQLFSETEQGVFYKILLSCPIYSNSAPKRKPATKA